MELNARYVILILKTDEWYDLDRVFRFEMQRTPTSTTSSNASSIVFPTSLHNSPVPKLPPACGVSSSAPSSAESINAEYTSAPAMYISGSDEFDFLDDLIEEPLPEEITLSILYEPMDDTSRQLSQLTTLRDYMATSPAMIWNFYELFPNITDHIFSLSSTHDGLRHSLLATSAVIRDAFSGGGEPSELYLLEKAESLRLLQHSISNDMIDELLAISVLMHISMDVLSGHLKHTKRHMRGLFLVIEQLQRRAAAAKTDLSPLAALVRRMALRTDFAVCSLDGGSTEFPSTTIEDEIVDKKWLTKTTGLSGNMSQKNIGLALASFELDNLMHRAYAFSQRSDVLRSSGDINAEEEIQLEYQKLVQSLEWWKQREIIREHEEVEQYGRSVASPSTDPHTRFLHHERLHLQSIYYAKLLNQWRMTLLWISFIVHPVPGPEPISHNRYTHAVDICRTHAALGKEGFIGPAWQALFFAGAALGGKKRYPMESEWLLDTLRNIALAYPVLIPVMEVMPIAWESDHFHWTGLAVLYNSVGLMRD
jgi:hypothetical protein